MLGLDIKRFRRISASFSARASAVTAVAVFGWSEANPGVVISRSGHIAHLVDLGGAGQDGAVGVLGHVVRGRRRTHEDLQRVMSQCGRGSASFRR